MYALIDGNNFYASCERVFNPDLNKKPIVVLSNNDGIIIARSNEAKQLGVKMGTPAFKIKKLIENNNVFAFSSNYALYGDMSQRMMQIFTDFSPDIEVYSIDEAFLDFSNFNNIDYKSLGAELRKRVKKYIGIPVSIGFAPTKTLAKIANKIAKKYMTKTGVALIDTTEKIEVALKMTSIEDVWGIGRKYSVFLKSKGIKTAWDFTQLSDIFIKKHLSVVGLRTKEELLGIACIPIEQEPPTRKAIRTARTFSKIVTDYQFVEEAISDFASKTARKLRKQNSLANLLTVFIRTNKFDKNKTFYSNSFTIQITPASNSSIQLIKYAQTALKIIYKDNYDYKKAGVMVSGLTPSKHRQMNLFDDYDYEKHRNIMKAIDRLNKNTGKEIVKIASQGQSEAWRLRQEHRSNRFTTRWDELIEIK